jgi:hypothetical protein
MPAQPQTSNEQCGTQGVTGRPAAPGPAGRLRGQDSPRQAAGTEPDGSPGRAWPSWAAARPGPACPARRAAPGARPARRAPSWGPRARRRRPPRPPQRPRRPRARAAAPPQRPGRPVPRAPRSATASSGAQLPAPRVRFRGCRLRGCLALCRPPAASAAPRARCRASRRLIDTFA